MKPSEHTAARSADVERSHTLPHLTGRLDRSLIERPLGVPLGNQHELSSVGVRPSVMACSRIPRTGARGLPTARPGGRRDLIARGPRDRPRDGSRDRTNRTLVSHLVILRLLSLIPPELRCPFKHLLA